MYGANILCKSAAQTSVCIPLWALQPFPEVMYDGHDIDKQCEYKLMKRAVRFAYLISGIKNRTTSWDKKLRTRLILARAGHPPNWRQNLHLLSPWPQRLLFECCYVFWGCWHEPDMQQTPHRYWECNIGFFWLSSLR